MAVGNRQQISEDSECSGYNQPTTNLTIENRGTRLSLSFHDLCISDRNSSRMVGTEDLEKVDDLVVELCSFG